MADELDGMATFVAVAEAGGFRAAGARLGVTHSAVSQALRRLEERLGVPLVRRTTRSVHLTEAGARLYASVGPALDEVRAAVAAVGELGDQPRGTLRVHTSSAALAMIGELLLPDLLAAHPHVRLDLVVSDAPVDIVAGGFDAGIQLGEVIDKDMIAVPVTGDLRLAVVGAPSYFARRGVPTHPRELVEHDCLNWHPTADALPYRWEFMEHGRDFTVAVPARVLSTASAINRSLAVAGLGVTLAYDAHVRGALERGDLVRVLERFCEPFPGYYLYYPQRRHASPALRALVDYLRRARQGGTSRGPARGTGQRPPATPLPAPDPPDPPVGAGAGDPGPRVQAVLCEAWQRARAAADPRCEALAQALRAVAREARAGGAPVTALLRALDRLAAADGGAAAGFARVRAWAGTQVAYYRDG